MGDLAPEHEQFWFDRYAEKARTGRPAHFEYTAAALCDRHFDVFVYPVGLDPDTALAAEAVFDRRH